MNVPKSHAVGVSTVARSSLRAGLRSAVQALAILMTLAACASEDWDNPHDPAGNAWISPCAGVPDELAPQCVFWDDFDRGLGRWHMPDVGSTKRPVISSGDDVRPGWLVLPACDGQAASLVKAEIELPDAPTRLFVAWRPAELDAGRLAVRIGSLEKTFSALSPDSDGWHEGSLDLSGSDSRSVVVEFYNSYEQSGGCGSVHVDLVSIRTG